MILGRSCEFLWLTQRRVVDIWSANSSWSRYTAADAQWFQILLLFLPAEALPDFFRCSWRGIQCRFSLLLCVCIGAWKHLILEWHAILGLFASFRSLLLQLSRFCWLRWAHDLLLVLCQVYLRSIVVCSWMKEELRDSVWLICLFCCIPIRIGK